MKAADIMTPTVVTIRGADTVAQAISVMRGKSLHGLIVDRRHDEDAYGIVTDADIVYKVIACGKDPNRVRVYEIMTKPSTSREAIAAWETVEELQAEAAHQRAEKLPKTAFDEYCEEFPGALEARPYDV